jgi:hypothetical protein
MSGNRTSEEVLEDKPRRCDACKKLLTREEVARRSCLCSDCEAVIDQQTEAKLEDAPWEGWFE